MGAGQPLEGVVQVEKVFVRCRYWIGDALEIDALSAAATLEPARVASAIHEDSPHRRWLCGRVSELGHVRMRWCACGTSGDSLRMRRVQSGVRGRGIRGATEFYCAVRLKTAYYCNAKSAHQ